MLPANEKMIHHGIEGLSHEEPYLSMIAVSRNDDYGGNAHSRMQVSFTGRLKQLEKYKINSEFIVMEWNPPADKPSLRDAIEWPKNLKYCTVRIITVPPEIHHRYEYSDRLNINGAVAINSGIRRARGKFVLPGNMDLLYSDELMQFIASKQLNENERYRIDRCDVDRKVLHCETLEEQLEFCRHNILVVHSNSTDTHRPLNRFRRPFPILHTMACGDFQLLSREWWHKLHAYSEVDIISAYNDGTFSYASYTAGVREVILKSPMRLYHIDHENKFNDRKIEDRLPGEKILRSSAIPSGLSKKLMNLYQRFLFHTGYHFKVYIDGIPTQHYLEYIKLCRAILSGKRSYILNGDSWGLRDEKLKEVIINTADWDKDMHARS